MSAEEPPLEVVILRYLTENWSDRIEHMDRIVIAAGLSVAIQDTLAVERARINAALDIAAGYESLYGGWPQVVGEIHAALTRPGSTERESDGR